MRMAEDRVVASNAGTKGEAYVQQGTTFDFSS